MRQADIKLCAPVTDIFMKISQDILPFIGAIEYKDSRHSVQLSKKMDTLFESPLGIISDAWAVWMEKEHIRSFLKNIKPLSFSVDLGPACRRYRNKKTITGIRRSYPQSKVLSAQEIITLAQKRIRQLRSYFTGKIKFEILNYYPTGVYEHVCEPGFIKDFIKATGSELLLDLAHARIASENLKIPFIRYLNQLPLENVSEVHISRPSKINGIWEDTHEMPEKPEFILLGKIIAKAGIKHITVEYYKDERNLIKLFKKLHAYFRIRPYAE